MRVTRITGALFAASLCPLLAPASFADDAKMDEAEIATLLLEASEPFDLEREDAVFLLDELSESWTIDGRLVRSVHQVVWIGTDYGLEHHADLRIPWDSAHQRFTLEALRTWRLSDNATIDAGPTAEVETLPAAADRSPDYCSLRETMLLHDGVELPCVMETRYVIEDTAPFRPGFAGNFCLYRPEPTMVSRFVLAGPTDAPPRWSGLGGLPDPVEGKDESLGLATWTFELRALPPQPQPAGADSLAGLPRVSWSSWPDHAALAAELVARLDGNAVLDGALEKLLHEVVGDARTPAEKARKTASFVATGTRFVDLPREWWATPRPAARTWSTAYADRLDRTVLAAALFRAAGFEAELGFLGAGFLAPGHDLPTLDWSSGPSLHVVGEGVDGWFDPSSATLSMGGHAILGRAAWRPGVDERPVFHPVGLRRPSAKSLRLDLARDEASSSWNGSGAFVANGWLSPYHRMSGADGEALGVLGTTVGALLGGATVSALSPETFTAAQVSFGFEVTAPVGEHDDLGRFVLEVEPFAEGLPDDLHEEHRRSAVHLPGSLDYRLELRVDLGALEVVRFPEVNVVENGAGRFEVACEREGGTLRLFRRLTLKKASYPAAEWPELRALLLLSEARAGRTLLLR